jgi:hypothetical protein
MDRATARTLKEEVEAAIAKIAKKHKLTLDLGNGTYSASSFNLRMSMLESGTPTKKERTTRTKTPAVPSFAANLLGLPLNVIGTEFIHKTKTLKVVGLVPSRPKNAVSLVDQNGKQFKCSVDQLKRFLKIK